VALSHEQVPDTKSHGGLSQDRAPLPAKTTAARRLIPNLLAGNTADEASQGSSVRHDGPPKGLCKKASAAEP
jgi:hypothetical protein